MAEGKYFYSKGEGNDGYIKNLEVLGYCDLDGKAGMFQMALYKTEAGRYLLYGAAFAAGPEGVGIMISDVTDPKNPVFIKKWRPFDIEEYPTTSIPKVQIAEDKLVFALTSGSGPGVLVGDRAKMKSLQGIMVYDLKNDPENPEYLGYWDCGVPYSMGVHRFMYNE